MSQKITSEDIVLGNNEDIVVGEKSGLGLPPPREPREISERMINKMKEKEYLRSLPFKTPDRLGYGAPNQPTSVRSIER